MRKHPCALATVSISARNTLYTDVYQRHHIEACGLLLGQRDDLGNWYVERVHPLPNICNSPVYFEFAPEDLLSLELAHPGKIIGVYHSHPGGLAIASSTDRENMKRVNKEQQIPWVWFIVCGPFSSTFKLDDKQLTKSRIIAYHHYDTLGLQQITLEFEPAQGKSTKR
jgi:proteasome lid subunit RPN8/RPN11